MILQMLMIDANIMAFKTFSFLSVVEVHCADCFPNIYLIDQPANEPNQLTISTGTIRYDTMVFPISLPG